jgi:serine acetyltransferase
MKPSSPIATKPSPSQGLTRQLKEDWCCHAKDWTKPGFRAIAVHRFGVWRMQFRSPILRKPLSLLYNFLFRHCRNVYGIELLYTVSVGRRVVIEHQGGITITSAAVIGDDCTIRQGVTIGIKSTSERSGSPILGKGVEIGAGAVILGDIIVGDHVKIGANAVVVSSVPEGETVVGVPAKIVKRKLHLERSKDPE